MPPRSSQNNVGEAALTSNILRLDSFGAEMAEGSEERPEFFLPSTVYKSVRNRDRTIVVGRKGTGKTAIGKALANEALNNPLLRVVELSFEEYPWRAHNSVFASQVTSTARYVHTWLFFLLIQLSKLIISAPTEHIRDKGGQDVWRGLHTFVTANWGSVEFDSKDTFQRLEYRFSGSLKPSFAGFGVGGVDLTTVERTRLGDSLPEMNKWLMSALADLLNPGLEYALVFDGLDHGFVTGDKDYKDSLVGLIIASAHFNRWLRALKARGASFLLIRDDVFDGLQFQDKNKITISSVQRMAWTDAKDGENSLKVLIDTRIRVLLDVPRHPDPWSLVFAENELLARNVAKYDYLVSRTYLRPRDLIRFANLCLSAAKTRIGDNGTPRDRIQNIDIKSVKAAYADYLKAELDDEVHAHHDDWQNWLELLRRVGAPVFAFAAFDDECRKAPSLCAGQGADELLKILYEFGIIGLVRRGGGSTQAEYWAYRAPAARFDVNASGFRVHPGVWDNLTSNPDE